MSITQRRDERSRIDENPECRDSRHGHGAAPESPRAKSFSAPDALDTPAPQRPPTGNRDVVHRDGQHRRRRDAVTEEWRNSQHTGRLQETGGAEMSDETKGGGAC